MQPSSIDKISVIVPAYNAADFLEETLLSVKSQSGDFDTELIVIDDGSVDDTKRIAENFADELILSPHKGVSFARNLGIDAAKGNYIAFLDADDVWEPDALVHMLAPFEANPALLGAFAYARDISSEGLGERTYSGTLPGTSLIKTDTVKAVGAFDTSLDMGETVDWLIRFRKEYLDRSLLISDVVCKRRIHAKNAMKDKKQREMASYAAIIRSMRKR